MTQEFKYTDWMDGEDSTAVFGAYFDGETDQIAITLTGGLTYVYQGVNKGLWDDFQRADSLGTFYANHIKNIKSRNSQFSQYDTFRFDKREPVRHLSAVKAEASQGETFTTVVLAVDGKVTLKVPGEVSAQDLLDGFIKTFEVENSGFEEGAVQVVSRSVTRVETF